MPDWQLNTPIAFFIFNRPDMTQRVFEAIAAAKPPQLLVVADGPRSNRPGEAERCRETRAIIDKADWPCEVLTNYSDTNLGCKHRVASGIDWIFEQVPEAIFLEDDCLPDPSFFRFCEELLTHYRDDERIGMIGGTNFQFGQRRTGASYYFSRYTHLWGWATWRRAWQHYDRDIALWPEVRDGKLLNAIFPTAAERRYWNKAIQAAYDKQIDTWDYQWSLALHLAGMVSIIPEVNLVTNLGFGPDATHTTTRNRYSEMPAESLRFPLVHPNIIMPHAGADAFTAEGMFVTSMLQALREKIEPTLRRILRRTNA